MSMRTIGLLIALLLASSAATVVVLFWIQNSQRRVMLSLNVFFARFELAEAVPVPVLLGAALGLGFVCGLSLMGLWWWRSASRARRLAERARMAGEGGPPW
jgi:uncharacterized membrane protein YciS (DUF1049 family)